MDERSAPLTGVRVLDFSTLLPGPLASLMLADAGADVIKIERPVDGDEVRSYSPRIGGTSAIYALLNRGKRAFAADLYDEADHRSVLQLAARADVILEQFRPGVARRLGFGYELVRQVNTKVVYCSITGYGQDGPLNRRAGHDLNYLAESGLLGVVTDTQGAPQLPVSNLADIAGGSYPAVVNILLALRRSEATGQGCHLDVSMTHNMQVLAFASLAAERAGDGWPSPNRELLTGASPRYQIYPTADGRYVAVAALEQKFWQRFVELVGLAPEHHRDLGQEQRVIAAVTRCISAQTSEHWRRLFAQHDACATVVATFTEAAEAGLVTMDDVPRVHREPSSLDPGGGGSRRVAGAGYDVPALHSSVSEPLLQGPARAPFPALERLPADMGEVWP